MEIYNDATVETITPTVASDNKISRKYLLRQILICSGVYAINFSYGLSFGSPTVLIAQLRQEANSSDAVSTEMASWLSSTLNYSGTVSAVILAILMRLIGRKLSFLLLCITSLIGFIIFYFSKNTSHIICSEILLGPLAASPLTLSSMILTEYTSPLYRGVFLTLKSATFFWGMWLANTIGIYFHWKKIGILAFICSMYSLLTVLLWPESPYWLTNKNRFEDCAVSHRWLKGCSEESELELEILIQSRKIRQSVQHKQLNIIMSVTKMVRSKTFYKPVSISLLLMSLYQFSGKLACGMYALDIIKRITGTESTAYTGMLILDGITVFGTYIGSGLSKNVKRRTLLLSCCTVGVIFLFCISFYLYLIHLEFIAEYTILSISLLIGYSLAISVGPMIMATTIISELMPVKYRSSSVLLLGCYTNILGGSVLKISPFIIKDFGARGLFVFFAVIELLLLIITNNVLPETKDKTILEIHHCLLSTK